MIEGAAGLEDLDLIGQTQLTSTTRQFLEVFLCPRWFQTEPVLAHARLFFNDFRAGAVSGAPPLVVEQRLKDYFCFLMLDFATVDPDLEQLPLAAAFEWSKLMGIEPEFDKHAAKELKLKARAMTKLKNEAAGMLAKADASA
jgi:hypothetical protein